MIVEFKFGLDEEVVLPHGGVGKVTYAGIGTTGRRYTVSLGSGKEVIEENRLKSRVEQREGSQDNED